MRVLITGACGWTARSIVERLRHGGHEVTGVDLPGSGSPPDVLDRFHECDVADLQRLAPLLASLDAVVHLAVAIGRDDYASPERPFRTNVQGTFSVLEAARLAGVQRAVLLGSAPVHLNLLEEGVVDARTDQPSSAGEDFMYDLTKYLQEVVARQFCETFGMTAIVLRAGHVVDGRTGRDPAGRGLAEVSYCRGGWVCRYDVAESVSAALAWDGKGYEAFHVIGAHQSRRQFDVARTERCLGITIIVCPSSPAEGGGRHGPHPGAPRPWREVLGRKNGVPKHHERKGHWPRHSGGLKKQHEGRCSGHGPCTAAGTGPWSHHRDVVQQSYEYH